MRFDRFLLSTSQRLNSVRPAKGAVQLLTTLFVVSLSLCLFPNLAVAASPHIYDVPQAGPPGSQTTTVGNGWDPNATLDVYLDSTDVGVVVTDNNGSFGLALRASSIRQNGLTIQIPANAVQGAHTITAVERITQLQAQVVFTVWSTTDWMQFQFDAQHTGFNPYETVLDRNTVKNLVQRWSYTTPLPQLISPVLANGKVYLATDNLYALDATTGSLLWEYPGQMGTNGPGAPAVAKGLIYSCTYYNGNIVALNADTGSLVWASPLGYRCTMPTVANGFVYFDAGDGVTALDASTGALLWKNSSEGGGIEVAVADGVVYTPTGYHLAALDARTGVTLWQYTTDDSVGEVPVVANGIVYASSPEVEGTLYAIYALNASTGALIWKYESSNYLRVQAVANGVAYVYTADYNLYAADLYALDAGTGTVLWEYSFGGAIDILSATVANGVLYVSPFNGFSAPSLYALDASTGGLLATYTTQTYYSRFATVDNGMVYFVVQDADYNATLYAFGLPDQGSKKFSPPQRPDPARLTPDWGLKPNTAATPSKK